MFLLLLSIPVLTIFILVLLGVGLACSPGLREVLLGLKGKNKFSFLNFISVEGVGASVIIVVIFSSGVLFPLYKLSDLQRAIDIDGLNARAEALEQELNGYRHPATWTIKGRFALPEEFAQDFETYLKSEAFWWQGNWEAFLKNADIRIVPEVTQLRPIRSSPYREAEFELQIQVPGSVDLPAEVGEIRYQHQGEDLSATLMFSGDFGTKWHKRGVKEVEFARVRLHQYLPLDHETFASREAPER